MITLFGIAHTIHYTLFSTFKAFAFPLPYHFFDVFRSCSIVTSCSVSLNYARVRFLWISNFRSSSSFAIFFLLNVFPVKTNLAIFVFNFIYFICVCCLFHFSIELQVNWHWIYSSILFQVLFFLFSRVIFIEVWFIRDQLTLAAFTLVTAVVIYNLCLIKSLHLVYRKCISQTESKKIITVCTPTKLYFSSLVCIAFVIQT